MRAFDPVQTLLRVVLVVAVIAAGYSSFAATGLFDANSLIVRVLVHAALFAVLGLVAGYSFPRRYRRHPYRVIGSFLGLVVALELVQVGLAGHSVAIADLVAGIVGAGVMVPVVRSLIGDEEGMELPPEVTEDQVQQRVTGNVQSTDITAVTPEPDEAE